MQNDPDKIRPIFWFMKGWDEGRVATKKALENFPQGVTVQDLDVVWVTKWLKKNTHFTAEELFLIQLNDSESPTKMFIFATQWPPTLQLNAHFLHMETFAKMSTNRSVDGGNRLNQLKAKGGYKNGVIDWTFGCYEFPVAEAGRVKAIKHITGKQIEVPSHVTIRTDADALQNWYDFDAEVLTDASHPQNLSQLMEASCKATKEGPWALQVYHGGNCPSFNDAFLREHMDLMVFRAELERIRPLRGVCTDTPLFQPDTRVARTGQPRKRCAEAQMTKRPRHVSFEGSQADAAIATPAAAASGLRGGDGEEDHECSPGSAGA